MFIVMFVAGLLLVCITFFVRSMCKPDREAAAIEAEAFREGAYRAKVKGSSGRGQIMTDYHEDARAEAEGEGFIPSWIYTFALIIGCLLMVPAIGSWLL
jgi:hypothetical protein